MTLNNGSGKTSLQKKDKRRTKGKKRAITRHSSGQSGELNERFDKRRGTYKCSSSGKKLRRVEATNKIHHIGELSSGLKLQKKKKCAG